MGLKKETAAPVAAAPVATAPTAAPESGTKAAIERLNATKTEAASKSVGSAYKKADPNDARGKTRCVQFQAALASPAIAGMKFKNMKEYLALVREAAEAGVAYTFEEDLQK